MSNSKVEQLLRQHFTISEIVDILEYGIDYDDIDPDLNNKEYTSLGDKCAKLNCEFQKVTVYTGEGYNNSIWTVFKFIDHGSGESRLFKIDGGYCEHYGLVWNDDFYEVEQYEKVTVAYRKVK